VRQKQQTSASSTRQARSHRRALRPMKHHGQYIASRIQRKWRDNVPNFLLGRREIIPSGKNTCLPAWSSDLCTGESVKHKPCNLHKDRYRNLHRSCLRPNTRGSTLQPGHGGKDGVTFRAFPLAGTSSFLRRRTRVCLHSPQICARGEARNANPATPKRTAAEKFTAHDARERQTSTSTSGKGRTGTRNNPPSHDVPLRGAGIYRC